MDCTGGRDRRKQRGERKEREDGVGKNRKRIMEEEKDVKMKESE